MKLTKALEAEILQFMENYWNTYFSGDLKKFSSLIRDDYHNIGTTEVEDWRSKDDMMRYSETVIDQIVGTVQIRNRKTHIMSIDPYFMVHEYIDLYINTGVEWVFYSKMRLSSLIEKSNHGLQVVHQHGSVPDTKAQDGETIGFQKISQENLELREAIKRRTIELEHKNRELEIESAVERVRAQSMAMHHPDDLDKVNKEILNQLNGLQVPGLTGVTFYLIDEQGWVKAWDFYSPGNIGDQNSYTLQYDFKKYEMMGEPFEVLRQTDFDYYVADYPLEKLERAVCELEVINPSVANVFKEALAKGILTHQWSACARISDGLLGVDLVSPPSEDTKTIVLKIAGAFNQAYQRFLDLQKAEEQAREAQIELSLEKIRSQVASMQESTDLLDIMVNIRSEFVALGHEAHYCWYMRWLPDKYEKAMTSGDGTQVGMIMTLPRHIHGDIPLVANWEQGDEPTLIFAMDVDVAVEYVDKMITLGDFEQVDPLAPTLDDIRHIGGLTFVMARTSQGEIGYSLPGEVHHPPEEAVNTLARFAGVFDLAYRRFEDLKAAEHQTLLIREERDRLEVALNELHATQTQLIQQEKLASLGQLTAGIAHEIKNPLNFVNNFSEVSIEMIEEALEELAKAKTQHAASQLEAIQETENILSDIKSNLSKIHEHGSRADGIVKSMLMHSRGGSGKMEPTDLNALIKEYVNLSFHGMRAGKTPINVDIQLDLDDSFGKIALIEEDFSRVLLNLCNNAFDAMREKTKTDNGYKPLLSISTKQLAKVVEIAITDNGPGIPDEIKDKILQPFFTTKKGTEGTGLGLSITHDIVKAHGGALNVVTKVGKGTEFIVQIPKT